MTKDTNDLMNSEECDANKSPVVNTDTYIQSDSFFPWPRAIDFYSTNGLFSFRLQRLTFKNYYMIWAKWHYTELLNHRLNSYKNII